MKGRLTNPSPSRIKTEARLGIQAAHQLLSKLRSSSRLLHRVLTARLRQNARSSGRLDWPRMRRLWSRAIEYLGPGSGVDRASVPLDPINPRDGYPGAYCSSTMLSIPKTCAIFSNICGVACFHPSLPLCLTYSLQLSAADNPIRLDSS
jgi:hypothetical protein